MLSRRHFFTCATSIVATPFLSLSASARSFPTPEPGQYEARVFLGNQRFQLVKDGSIMETWDISSARQGKVTPIGSWNPYFLSLNHRSSLYNNAPMPYAVFYSGNYAIHGTDQISRLGSRASAGCVRLHPDNAAKCFGIAHHLGFDALKVIVMAEAL
jgi:lipoprotein-anchoring transpeptidase ErfK/SrfK